MKIMKRWIGIFIALAVIGAPAQAGGLMSDKSLALTCLTNTRSSREACEAYIHGVVEVLWLNKEISKVIQGVATHLTVCENVISQDWALIIQTVKSNIKNMENGLAIHGIANALNKSFCKK